MSRPRLGACAVLLLIAALAGCSNEKAAAPAPAQMPDVAVSTVQVTAETLPVVSELPGRIAPMVTADVRPRVTGMILKRVFEQGSAVSQGDLLYVIDPAPFKAKVESAQATLDSATAARTLANQKADRQTELRKKAITSGEDYDTAVAALAQANADVSRAQADLQTARLELQYTEVRSPISGSIGRAYVTEGSLVSPTSDALATVQQINPVYADFTQPAGTLVILKNAIAKGQLQADATGSANLKLISGNDQPYPHDGKLLFSEASVNSATGQIILRGEFPNPDRNLLPGMYVRGLLQQGALEGAVAVPEQSIQRDTAGNSQLYVVDKDSKVEVRNVKLGWPLKGRWVVIDGLKAGEQVIVEGFQRIGPGAKVKAEPWTDPTAIVTKNATGN